MPISSPILGVLVLGPILIAENVQNMKLNGCTFLSIHILCTIHVMRYRYCSVSVELHSWPDYVALSPPPQPDWTNTSLSFILLTVNLSYRAKTLHVPCTLSISRMTLESIQLIKTIHLDEIYLICLFGSKIK